jgi:hypothetical protein
MIWLWKTRRDGARVRSLREADSGLTLNGAAGAAATPSSAARARTDQHR